MYLYWDHMLLYLHIQLMMETQNPELIYGFHTDGSEYLCNQLWHKKKKKKTYIDFSTYFNITDCFM